MMGEGLNRPLLALKMEKGAMSQGIRAAPEAGKGRKRDSPLEPPEKDCSPAPAETLMLAQCNQPISDF